MPDATPEPLRVHESAAVGFERAADAYERGRPSFPQDAVSYVVSALGLGAGVRVLELGPGTGKLTRLLTPTGSSIVGLEPVDAMRRRLRKIVPGCHVVGGIAEALPFRAGVFGAAVASQVFHWLDGERAVPELAAALTRGAGVALLWNVRDERHPWVRALTDVMEPHRGSTPTHRAGAWRRAFETSNAFTSPALRSFPYVHRTTRDLVIDRIGSVSFIAALPPDRGREVAAAVRSILAHEGADAGDDPVDFPYRTDVWTTIRR